MYEFAILLFSGLALCKAVDVWRHYAKGLDAGMHMLATLGLGVGLAYLLDYSMFAAWGVSVRSEHVGNIVTGFVMAGFAGAWHQALGLMREWAHRYHGEASEIEARLRRAA